MLRRRTEIEIEARKTWVVKRPRHSTPAWCAECAGRVEMIAPDDAAIIFSLNTRAIYSGVEAAKVHFTETAQGSILVCPNSLAEMAKRT